MRITLLLLLFSMAAAQEPLSEAKLQAFKDSSVLIWSDSKIARGSGSGFLVLKDGETGYVVTNNHVTDAIALKEMQVTFFSGTDREKTVVGTYLGSDEHRDLALLKVTMPGLPKPVDIPASPKLVETDVVYVIGFPMGQMLKTGQKCPAVTVTKGSISSLRRNRWDELEVVQVDGGINSGNSGGPVLDKNGGLVGVSVAKMVGTAMGFAIPAWQVTELLDGRIVNFTLDYPTASKGTFNLRVALHGADPLSRIKTVTLLMVPRDQVKALPEVDGKGVFPPIAAGAREYPLKLEAGTNQTTIELTGDPAKDIAYAVQVRYVRGDGTRVHMFGREFRAWFGGAGGEQPKDPNVAAAPAVREADDWLWDDKKPEAPGAPAATPSPRPKPDQVPQPGVPDNPNIAVAQKTGKQIGGPKMQNGVVSSAKLLEPLSPTVETLPLMMWSSDATSAYFIDTRGVLRKLNVPSLIEECRIELGRNCDGMVLTKEGVAVRGAKLWVLDPTTLEVRRTFESPKGTDLGGHPDSSLAYIAAGDRKLHIVNLATGKLVQTFDGSSLKPATASSWENRIREWTMPTVTPDGKYLVTTGWGALQRFRIDGDSLVYEEVSPHFLHSSKGTRIVISSDSKYVVGATHNGHMVGPDGKPGMNVFRVTDLSTPVIRVPIAATAFGFDKVGGRIYGQVNTGFSVMTPMGSAVDGVQPTYQVGAGDAYQILVHPDGLKLLIAGNLGTFWVTLSK